MAKPHELREKGLRLTPQRELVLQAVRQLGHATPEEVAEKVRSTHPGINLSTVYRNLETLENVGLVIHTHLGHGGATYHAADRAKPVAIKKIVLFPVKPPINAVSAKSAPINCANLGALSYSLGTGPESLG